MRPCWHCSSGCSPAAVSQSARAPGKEESLPALTLVVAAHDEEQVIEAKVANALALDYPRERLQVIVACDGCADETVARARAAGADLVLDLPRGGKIRAQDQAVEQATGELIAFSDANSSWEADAALRLGERLFRPARRLRLRAGPLRAGGRGPRGGKPGGPLLAL